MRDRGGLVPPIGWRACQTVGGRANPSAGGKPLAGVTSGAPTSPGQRFVNRRGDIHVARMAGGNMQDRGSLIPPIGRRACQSVGGRAKPSTGVTSGAPTFPGRRFGSVKPSAGVTSGAPTSPGRRFVPPNRSTGVTSGAPAFPGRRFVNRRGDIHVARVAGGNMRERWIETSARGRQEYIK